MTINHTTGEFVGGKELTKTFSCSPLSLLRLKLEATFFLKSHSRRKTMSYPMYASQEKSHHRLCLFLALVLMSFLACFALCAGSFSAPHVVTYPHSQYSVQRFQGPRIRFAPWHIR